MSHRLNISDMKIYHCSRQTDMTKTLLYIQKGLAIFKQMACSTMAKRMNRDGVVKAGLHKCILHDDTYISWLDGLRSNSLAMGLEDEVIAGIPSLEALQHFELLFGDGHDTVLLPLALIDEYLLSLKTDVNPFEAASLTYS